jgi:hypothetical protein
MKSVSLYLNWAKAVASLLSLILILSTISATLANAQADVEPSLIRGPVTVVSPNILDFGPVQEGEVGRESITVSNVGDAELIVSNIILAGHTPFDFCGLVPTGFVLIPSASKIIEICFSPTEAGTYEDEIVISSNDPLNPNKVIPVIGEGVPQDAPEGDLDVDYDRDGKIDNVKDDPKEAETVKYLVKGALVLANLDDDAEEKKVDAGDDEITSVKDQEDFSKMIVRQIVLPHDGWTAFLEITKGAEHIRVFKDFDKGAKSILGPVPGKPGHWDIVLEYKIPSSDLAKGDIDFYVEGITPGEQVMIELKVYLGDELQKASSDAIQMLVTPIIFHPNTHKTNRMFYSNWRIGRGRNSLFTAPFQKEAQKLLGKGSTIGIRTVAGTFVQDIFEIGYQRNPSNHAGKKITMPTVVDVPWQVHSLNNYPKDSLLAPNFGFLKLGGEVDNTGADYGGNLETIPEFQADLPFGHIVIGENMSQKFKDFLVKQKVQAKGETKLVILPVDPDKGSTVFHVDEVINVVPSSTGKKFKVVIGDLDEAIDRLKKNVQKNSPKALRELKEKYTSDDNKNALKKIREQLSSILKILKDEAGLEDADIVSIPVLYPLEFAKGYGLPNAINLQVIDQKVFVPSPVYEKGTNKKKSKRFIPFSNLIRKNLKEAGVKNSDIIFVDTSEMSGFGGEAHCATNSDRKPPD